MARLSFLILFLFVVSCESENPGLVSSSVPGNSNPESSSSSSTIAFSDVAVGMDLVAEVAVSYEGTSGVASGKIAVAGTDASDFELIAGKNSKKVGSEIQIAIESGETASFIVVKKQNLNSASSATLELTTGGSTSSKTLTATATNTTQVWLRADDITFADVGTDTDSSGTLTDGDLINTWQDIPGNLGANPTAAAAGNRPTYFAEGIGGMPSLYFDGTSDTLEVSNANSTNLNFTKSDSITFIFVSSPAHGANHIFLNRSEWGGTWRGWGLRVTASYITNYFFGFGPGTYEQADTTSGDSPQGGKYIYSAVYDGSGSNVSFAFYQDGASKTNNHSIVGGPTGAIVPTTANFCIGSRQRGDGYINIWTSEIMIFNEEVSTAKRKAIECYLAQKYNMDLAISNSCTEN